MIFSAICTTKSVPCILDQCNINSETVYNIVTSPAYGLLSATTWLQARWQTNKRINKRTD